MALVPSSAYPGQIAVDANYPQGKARNVTVSGDGTGTPLEQKWVNDLFGFEQALLAAGGVTPSGTPDSVAASDYLTALRSLQAYATYSLGTSSLSSAATIPLTETHDPLNLYTLASNQVQVPVAGDYLVSVTGNYIAAFSGFSVDCRLLKNANPAQIAEGTSSNPGSGLAAVIAFEFVTTIAVPPSEKLSLTLNFAGGSTAAIGSGLMRIQRVY